METQGFGALGRGDCGRGVRELAGNGLRAAILSEAILVVAIVAAFLTPGPPPAPPAIAAVPGPINVQAPSDETVATSGDAGATLLKESTQPAHVKVPVRGTTDRPCAGSR